MANGAPAGLPRRTPRPWHGMTPSVWVRLLARNRFAVSPSRIPMALAVSAFSVLNAGAALVQRKVDAIRRLVGDLMAVAPETAG